VGRLALDELRPGLGMKVRVGLAVALEAIGHVFDLVVALRVNHHGRALFASDGENLEQLPIGQDHVVVGHEHFE
jgi:hypothetical protein